MDIRELRRLSIAAQAAEAKGIPYSDELAAFLVQLDTKTCFELVETAYQAQFGKVKK